MNGSVWYGRCLGKLIRHQLRKNSHGKLFIISLTTRTHRSAKKKSTIEWKEIIFPLNLSRSGAVVIHSHSLDFDCHRPPSLPLLPGLLSEKLLIESHHAWIRRKIALKYSPLSLSRSKPMWQIKWFRFKERGKGFCVVNIWWASQARRVGESEMRFNFKGF